MIDKIDREASRRTISRTWGQTGKEIPGARLKVIPTVLVGASEWMLMLLAGMRNLLLVACKLLAVAYEI